MIWKYKLPVVLEILFCHGGRLKVEDITFKVEG
jgi:hypothetical protein